MFSENLLNSMMQNITKPKKTKRKYKTFKRQDEVSDYCIVIYSQNSYNYFLNNNKFKNCFP